MAVIGIGTTSRASVEDVLEIIAATKAMMAEREFGKTPSPQPSPGKLALASLQLKVTASASGCGWGEGVGSARCAGVPFSARVEEALFSPLPSRERGRGEGALIRALAALNRPSINPVLFESALQAGLDLILLTLDELRAAAHLCVTHSEQSMKHYGIPSVAEAAALAAAGTGALLLVPRFRGRNTTASVAAIP